MLKDISYILLCWYCFQEEMHLSFAHLLIVAHLCPSLAWGSVMPMRYPTSSTALPFGTVVLRMAADRRRQAHPLQQPAPRSHQQVYLLQASGSLERQHSHCIDTAFADGSGPAPPCDHVR
jgi:hypothetical protein